MILSGEKTRDGLADVRFNELHSGDRTMLWRLWRKTFAGWGCPWQAGCHQSTVNAGWPRSCDLPAENHCRCPQILHVSFTSKERNVLKCTITTIFSSNSHSEPLLFFFRISLTVELCSFVSRVIGTKSNTDN